MIQAKQIIDNMSAQDFIDADKKFITKLEEKRKDQIRRGFR